jgi:hypothetical protein
MLIGRLDESRQRFATIDRDLARIKSILLRHEKVLAELPEAIRQKIGFQQYLPARGQRVSTWVRTQIIARSRRSRYHHS